MKYIPYHILTCLLCLWLLPAHADEGKLTDTYTTERPVVIACDWDKAPYEFLNDNGQPAGSNIDVIRIILKKLNLPYRFVMKEWGNAIATFERGEADLIFASGRRYTRAPYFPTENIINYNRVCVAMLKRDSVEFVTQPMLEQQEAVFKPSDYAVKYFIEGDSLRASKIEFQSPRVALSGIIAGDHQYFVWGEEPLKWKIRQMDLDQLVLCDTDIPISEVHIIGRDHKLIDEIDDHFSRLKQSGEIERINNHWMHPDREKVKAPPIAVFAIVFSVIITLLSFALYHVTRKKVQHTAKALADVDNIIEKVGNVKELPQESKSHDQAEQAIHELQYKYEALFNIPVIAMSFYDENGWIIDINDAMKAMCGFEKKENEHYWMTVCMFDTPLMRTAYSRNRRDDLIIGQHMDYPEIGLDRYIEFHVHPIFNEKGEIINYFDSSIDVTEERNREKAIREQEKEMLKINEQINKYEHLLRYLLDHGKMMVWKGDFATRTMQFARSLKQAEFVETFDDYLERIDIDQRDHIQEVWSQYREGSGALDTLIHFNYMPDSDEAKWINSVGIPLKDDQGTITGYFGINRDVTDLVEAQEQLRQEKSRAEDSGHRKSMFLASMSHELRTPLNSIIGFADLLRTAETPEEHQEFIRIIRNNCDMLLRLINDIIRASSISESEKAYNPTTVDFAKAFDDICQDMKKLVNEPIAFIKDNPFDSFFTSLDKGRIRQVITNFVTNSVKHTKEGYIKVGYSYQSRGLYIYCEDTGAGIPKDQQEAVFERFVKLNEFTQGTGLGLNICQAIARQCKGKIGVISEGEGHGSTFWFWIPCKKMNE